MNEETPNEEPQRYVFTSEDIELFKKAYIEAKASPGLKVDAIRVANELKRMMDEYHERKEAQTEDDD